MKQKQVQTVQMLCLTTCVKYFCIKGIKSIQAAVITNDFFDKKSFFDKKIT